MNGIFLLKNKYKYRRSAPEQGETMKYLKVLGVAAFAAMALMAFGASTASATTLFTDAAKTKDYPAETTIHATLKAGTTATLERTNGEPIAHCSGSTVHGTTGNTTGTAISGAIGTLSWSGCSTTTDTVTNGSLDIEHIAGTSDGTVTGTGNQVTLSLFGVTCTYGTGEGTKLGTLTGGSPASMKVNAVVNKTAGGFLCPTTGFWTAEYVITAPHAVYVGA